MIYRQDRIHNPGALYAGYEIRQSGGHDKITAGQGSFVRRSLVRLIGGKENHYSLHLQGDDSIEEQDGCELMGNLFDLAGTYVAVTIRNRGFSGSVHAVRDELLHSSGPLPKLFRSILKSHDVTRWDVTFSVIEDALGLGRIEWSVNK